MSKWWLLVLFGLLTHFGASYLIPLEEKDQGALGGLLRWALALGDGRQRHPWAVSVPGYAPRRVLDRHGSRGPVRHGRAGRPRDLGPHQLVARAGCRGASLVIVLMVGFFGRTKILPIVAALVAIWTATVGSTAFKVG